MSRPRETYVVPGRPVFHDTECQHVRRSVKMQVVVTADGLRRCKHCEEAGRQCR